MLFSYRSSSKCSLCVVRIAVSGKVIFLGPVEIAVLLSAGIGLDPLQQHIQHFLGPGGTVDLALLSSGMYVAMVTTVAGLIVGIPAYFGYNYLVARIEKLVFQMEANSIAFMDILNQPVK